MNFNGSTILSVLKRWSDETVQKAEKNHAAFLSDFVEQAEKKELRTGPGATALTPAAQQAADSAGGGNTALLDTRLSHMVTPMAVKPSIAQEVPTPPGLDAPTPPPGLPPPPVPEGFEKRATDTLVAALTDRRRSDRELVLPTMPTAIHLSRWKITVYTKLSELTGWPESQVNAWFRAIDTSDFESLANCPEEAEWVDAKLRKALEDVLPENIKPEILQKQTERYHEGKALLTGRLLKMCYESYRVEFEGSSAFTLRELLSIKWPADGQGVASVKRFLVNWAEIVSHTGTSPDVRAHFRECLREARNPKIANIVGHHESIYHKDPVTLYTKLKEAVTNYASNEDNHAAMIKARRNVADAVHEGSSQRIYALGETPPPVIKTGGSDRMAKRQDKPVAQKKPCYHHWILGNCKLDDKSCNFDQSRKPSEQELQNMRDNPPRSLSEGSKGQRQSDKGAKDDSKGGKGGKAKSGGAAIGECFVEANQGVCSSFDCRYRHRFRGGPDGFSKEEILKEEPDGKPVNWGTYEFWQIVRKTPRPGDSAAAAGVDA